MTRYCARRSGCCGCGVAPPISDCLPTRSAAGGTICVPSSSMPISKTSWARSHRRRISGLGRLTSSRQRLWPFGRPTHGPAASVRQPTRCVRSPNSWETRRRSPGLGTWILASSTSMRTVRRSIRSSPAGRCPNLDARRAQTGSGGPPVVGLTIPREPRRRAFCRCANRATTGVAVAMFGSTRRTRPRRRVSGWSSERHWNRTSARR